MARAEFEGHVYAMVLHDHQAHPHVHLAVRAEGFSGKRLNPRKADLARWRETFARELRDRGIEAIATRQPVHGASKNYPPRWRVASNSEGRTRVARPVERTTPAALQSRTEALHAWAQVHQALAQSERPDDRQLAAAVGKWLTSDPEVRRTRALVLPPNAEASRVRGYGAEDSGPTR